MRVPLSIFVYVYARACVMFRILLCMGLYLVNIYNPINAKNPKNCGNTRRVVCVCEIQKKRYRVIKNRNKKISKHIGIK